MSIVRSFRTMPSREAAEDVAPTHVERDTRTFSDVAVKSFMEERYRQLNVEHIIGAGTAQERYELHRQLTKDITDLSEALLLWKRSATLSAPVSRLPIEVLENVFLHLAVLDPPITPLCGRFRDHYDTDDEDAAEDFSDELSELASFENFPTWHKHDCGSLGWIKVSHICHSWRDVALLKKSLWAGAVGILPLANEEFVHRAGSCHLSITVRESRRRCLDLYDAFSRVPHSSVKSICAYFTEHELYSSIDLLMGYIYGQKTPWDALESLEVSANGTPRGSQRYPLITPALKYAKMINCTLPFVASGLQRLSIVYDADHPGRNALPLASLLSYIDGCQNTLQELELLRCLSVYANTPKPPIVAPFVALRRFELGGDFGNLLRDVRHHIGYPADCDISFHTGEGGTFHFALRMLADDILEQDISYGLVLSASEGPYKAILVSVCQSATLDSGGAEFFVERRGTVRRVYFDLPEYHRHLHLGEILDAASEIFQHYGEEAAVSAFEDVGTLSIFDLAAKPAPVGACDVARFFARTPMVHTLQLYGSEEETLKGICDVHASDIHGHSESGMLVLPELTVLRLSAGATPLLCEKFAELLEMRAEGVEGVTKAKRLSRLIVDKDVVIADPENEESAIRRLKEIVDKLSWRLPEFE
ncbi:hypothetical protein PENSPDRAFT_755136 [Peniophora sp. CONT]|nr:hypothetical protein PENSPDRAFT_755136 [Peniophora sp. CONT]